MYNNCFIHEKAEIHSELIGEGTKIWQYSIVLAGARIGKDCNINSHCFIESDVSIRDNVTIKYGVYIWDGVTLEDEVFIGPNVTFTNDLYPKSKHYPESYGKTIIRKGASIGANATILCGIEIGEGALVGAGSVVTKNIPPGEKWYGNPAKMHGKI